MNRRSWTLVTPTVFLAISLVLFLALGQEALQWPLALWALATVWSFWAAPGEQSFPLSGLGRFLILILLLVIAVGTAGWGNWLVIASQVLILMLAFKAVELQGQRDSYQVAALVLLGMGIAAWLRVDLLLGVYILLELLMILFALLWSGYRDAAPHGYTLRQEGRALRQLLLFDLGFAGLLLPVLAVFFVMLPRTPTPLWHWGEAAGNAQSGFQADLSPTGIARLSLNPAVAFSAKISGPAPNPSDLYWQGAILWQDLGGAHWERGATPARDFADGKVGARAISGRELSVLLGPGDNRYLFTLGFPSALQSSRPARIWPDGTVELQEPSHEPLRYSLVSGPAPIAPLSPALRAAALQLPYSVDPAVRQLAAELRGKNAAATVERILHWFHGPSFHYSLESPPGYPRGQSLGVFLLKTHVGFCEYYAAGLALLLRLDGVPARVVVGYHGGEYNPLGGFWVVRQSMAHAWVQAWSDPQGWVNLDATPAGTTSATASSQGSGSAYRLPVGERLWSWLQWQWLNWVIQLSPDKQRSLWTAGGEAVQALSHWRLPNLPKSPSFAAMGSLGAGFHSLLALLGVAGLTLAVAWRRWRRLPAAERWRRLSLQRLRRAGLVDLRPGGEQAWAEGLDLSREEVAELMALIHAQRYGPRPSQEGDRALAQALKRCAES